MKWLSFLIFVSLGIGCTHTAAICADPEESVEIESIVYSSENGEEKITFQLSGPLEPVIFFMKGDRPRLVIDFYKGFIKEKRVVPVGDSDLVTAIRTGMHVAPKKKLRVVIDFTQEFPIQYTKDLSLDANMLVITVRSVYPEDQKQYQPSQEQEAGVKVKKMPSKEGLEPQPLGEKPAPSVVATQKSDEASVAENGDGGQRGVEVAKILDISFDDTSNRGEMVLFRLNDFYPPVVSAMEKESPRVICDFMDMDVSVDIQESISANGKYVQRIKTIKEYEPNKIRIVLELSPGRDYDLQQVYFKNDNLFVLIINELSPEAAVQQEKPVQ